MLLYVSGLFGLFTVWVSSLSSLETTVQKIWVSLILLGIAFLFMQQHTTSRIPFANVIRCFLQTVLAGCLFIFKPGWSIFPIVFFVLSPQVMMDFPIKIGISWLVLFSVITAVGVVNGGGLSELVSVLPYIAGYMFFGLFGWTMKNIDLERRRSNQLLADLQVAHEKLQRYTERVEELTITEERNRIAREMHDTLGHRLTIAAVQLDGAQRLIYTNPQKVEQIIKTVHEQVKDGLAELRKTVAIMRAPVDDDMPLQQALIRLVNQMKDATGMNIHLDISENLPGLPSAYRHAFFRAAQEGLTNVERHADAGEVWLVLNMEENNITLTIEDDGVGLKPEMKKNGLGLTGMQERADLLGGTMSVQERDGGGTRLSFCLPVMEENPE